MIDLKGAIFDVDGTILDSMTAWYDITVDYFRGQGIILGSIEADRIQNMTLEESIPYIRNKYLPQMSAETIFAGFKARMEHAYRSTIPPKSGGGKRNPQRYAGGSRRGDRFCSMGNGGRDRQRKKGFFCIHHGSGFCVNLLFPGKYRFCNTDLYFSGNCKNLAEEKEGL